MKPLCIKLPEKYFEGLEELVKAGIFPTISEATRVAIREFLERELWVGQQQQRNRRQLTFA